MPTILLKKSDTPSAVPTTANLTNLAGGVEVAVNTADKRMFTMNSSSAVVELGTNPSSLTCADASFTVARVGSLTISSLSLTNATFASATITNLTSTSATISSALTLSGGTANGVLYLNASKVATSGSALVYDGNLGVNTASPATRVHAVSLTNYQYRAAYDASNYMDVGYFGTNTVAPSNPFNAYYLNGTEGMRLTSTGLGIGTASPETKLDIVGTSGTEQFRIGNTSGGTDLGINVTENVGAVINSAEGATARSIQFQTGGTNAVFISTAGAVGIGTSSPAEKLEVEFSTNGYILADNSTDTNTGIKFANTGRTYGIFTDGGSGASNSLRFFDFTANADRMRINNDGNLGLGVTPGAWAGKAIQIGTYSGYGIDGNGNAFMANNAINTSSSSYVYTASSLGATQYRQAFGVHSWYTAPSGTAGNTITFTQAMTLDASGNLGVGTTSPSRRLHVYSTGNIPVRIETNTSDTKIEILTSSGTQYVQGSVNDLLFGTNNTERGRFTAGGDFLVGTTTTSSLAGAGRGLIEVNGSSDSAFAMKANNTLYGYLYNSASEFRVANVTSNPVTFFTNNAERARFNTTGAFVFAGGTTTADGIGITFPATQSASSNANTLDDYEEGTWTPTVEGSTSPGTGGYTTQIGRYTRIGRVVTCQAYIAWTSHTGTGNLYLTGLPFTLDPTTDNHPSATIGLLQNVALTAGNIATAYGAPNSTRFNLIQYPTGGGTITFVPMDTAGEIIYSATYITAT